MKKINIIIIFIFASSLFSSEIIDYTEDKIISIFPESKITNYKYPIKSKLKKEIQNTVKQKFFRDKLYVWKIDSDSTNFYAVLDNVKGKSMPITFLVIFNDKQEVYHSLIIKYREAYGGEVAGKNWLDQFLSYTKDSKYKVGENIDAISGATISVHSVTKGIHKLSYLIDDIINYTNAE